MELKLNTLLVKFFNFYLLYQHCYLFGSIEFVKKNNRKKLNQSLNYLITFSGD